MDAGAVRRVDTPGRVEIYGNPDGFHESTNTMQG
jgi:hypothetical protein